jgi:outer membrane protein
VFRGRWALPGCLFVLCGQAVGQGQAEALVLSPDGAVTYALERNLDLKAARLAPQIATLEVKAAEAAWSPYLSGSVGFAGNHSPPLSVLDPISGPVTKHIAGATSITQALPWGFSWTAGWDAERLTSNSPLLLSNPQLTANGTVAITQHLVKGFTIDEARANRLIAVKGQTVSEAGLASSVAATTYAVLRAYWTWIYTREYLAVEQRSLALAQSLLQDDRERASLGKIAGVDVIEVEAEVARRSDVILSAAKDVANAQDEVRLLIFAPEDPEQTRTLASPSELAEPGSDDEPAEEITVRAFDSRQDLRVLRAYLDIDDVTVRRLRNDRLPDVWLSLAYTGQGAAGGPNPGSAVRQRSFGSAFADVGSFRYPGWSAELSVSVPIGKSQAAAEAAKAAVKRTQEELMLRRAEQQVATEVRSTMRTVEANRQRLPLTGNAVRLAERRLEAEQQKFLVGLSTSFLVIQAQRDLTTAREGLVKSVLDYRLSLADLQAVRTISLPQ